jgi:protein TonB
MAGTLPVSGATFAAGAGPGAWRERSLGFAGYGLTAFDPAVRARRALTLPASVALHTAGALALVVVPLLSSDALPEPPSGIRAFLVEPISVPPPPPPPAARPAAAPRVAPRPQPQAQAFVAPVEVPTEIAPEQSLDLGDTGGSADGVEGGVPGGVVGGIVGGLPEAPPPPVVPVRVGGNVREPRRIVSVAPVYPVLAAQARLYGTVVLEALIDERGRVTTVKPLTGLPMLTEAAVEAVKKWVYTPTLLNGVPTPIVMTVSVHFHLTGPKA